MDPNETEGSASSLSGAVETGIQRGAPQDIPEERRALVKLWAKRVKEDKAHWKSQFDQMRHDQRFARGFQWPGQTDGDDRYVANLIHRHVQQKTASLYAKNPRFFYKRKKKMDTTVWDGSFASLQKAMTDVQMLLQPAAAPAGPMPGQPPGAMPGAPMAPPPPADIMQSVAILQDATKAQQQRQLLERVGKTMEIVVKHEVDEQQPPFKRQMKQLVRRTLACKVGYVKMGYERVGERRPEDADKIRDATEQMATLERLIADCADDTLKDAYCAEREQLKVELAAVQVQEELIVREGLTFDFPKSHTIIPDKRCHQLNGFIGSQWVTQEFVLSIDDVKEIYKIDLQKGEYTEYRAGGMDENGRPNWTEFRRDGEKNDKSCATVWEIYYKRDKLKYIVIDGYPDFAREPAAPEIGLERFWPFFQLTLNDTEDDENIFPPSDVELLRHMQLEYNRSREGLREHRIAARPAMATSKGSLDDEDKMKLEGHPANAVVELQGLAPGQKVDDLLQPIKKPPIDPAVYDTEYLFADMQRATGSQETQFGGTSGSTATETSIAEGARMSSVSSNVDDLDDMLQELARAMGQVLLRNMSKERVLEIAGHGAVWPELTAQEVADEVTLEVEAGSSGRPNKAAEVQNFVQLAPILQQTPGVNPEWFLKQAVQRLDDRLEIEDAYLAGLPSMTMMNSMKPDNGGQAPAQDKPAAQGGNGGANGEKPPGQEMQPPAAPAPASGLEAALTSYLGGGPATNQGPLQ